MSISAGCLGRRLSPSYVEYSTSSTVSVAVEPRGRANITGTDGTSGKPTSPCG